MTTEELDPGNTRNTMRLLLSSESLDADDVVKTLPKTAGRCTHCPVHTGTRPNSWAEGTVHLCSRSRTAVFAGAALLVVVRAPRLKGVFPAGKTGGPEGKGARERAPLV